MQPVQPAEHKNSKLSSRLRQPQQRPRAPLRLMPLFPPLLLRSLHLSLEGKGCHPATLR